MGRASTSLGMGALVGVLVFALIGPFAGHAGAAPPRSQPHPLDWCPEAQLTVSPDHGYTGDTAQFQFAYTNSNGNAVSIYSWGVTYSWVSGQRNLGTATVPGLGSHTFTDSEILPASAQSASITVSANGQASGDWFSSTCNWNPWTFTVNQLPAAPTVIATASVTSGSAPLSVSFSATVSQGLGPFTYSWTMGDGATASSDSLTHTYTTAGTFSAQVVVTDSRGRSASNSVTVTVTAASGNGGGGGGGGSGSSSSSTPTDYTPYYYGLAVAVILVVAVAAVLFSRRKGGGASQAPPIGWTPPAQPPAPPRQ